MRRRGIWIQRKSTTLCWGPAGVLGWYSINDMGHVLDTVIRPPAFHFRIEGFTPPVAKNTVISVVIPYRVCFCWEATHSRSHSNFWGGLYPMINIHGIWKCWPYLLNSGQLQRLTAALQLPKELAGASIEIALMLNSFWSVQIFSSSFLYILTLRALPNNCLTQLTLSQIFFLGNLTCDSHKQEGSRGGFFVYSGRCASDPGGLF